MKGREPTDDIHKYYRSINAIRRTSLEEFWSREPGTVRGNLNMLRKMGERAMEDIELEYWFPLLGTYPLKYELRM